MSLPMQKYVSFLTVISVSLLAFGWGTFYCGSAQAGVYIEVTGGQVGGISMAVADFKGDQALGSLLKQVISNDLQAAGQFRLKFNGGAEVEYALKGGLEPQGRSEYLVHFELLDVLRHQSKIAMRFQGIKERDLRALGHHISDLIFEKLMGIKGVFSTRVAYVNVLKQSSNQKKYLLEIADQDGHNTQTLYTSHLPLMSPAWSPDAQKLAFVTFDGHRSAVNVIDVTSKKMEKITQFPGINGAPAWSPDGESLALVLSKDGGPRIYVADLYRRKLRQVSHGPGIDTEPRWFPDGRSLVFTSDRGGKPQVYKLHLNTGHIERLTFTGAYNARPSVTPDGKYLVTMHRAEKSDGFSIAVQHLGTGQLKLLTHSAGDESPTVAPNGMMVLYGTREGILGAVSIDGRVRLRLPSQTGVVQEPAWAPFNPS